MTQSTRRLLLAGTGALALALVASPVSAQKKYDEGATDTEIKIGNTNPYSGNLSAYGTIGKAIDAYFKMVNEQGGINGRKINFITYDDGYAPPKTVEMVRKLVEEDKVLFVFQTLGTPPNTAIQKYLNGRRCRNCSPPPAPPMGSLRGEPVDDGLPARLRHGVDHLRQAHPGQRHRPKIGVSCRTTTTATTSTASSRAWHYRLDRALATYEVTDPTRQPDDSAQELMPKMPQHHTPKFAAQAIKRRQIARSRPLHQQRVGLRGSAEACRLRNAPGIITAPRHGPHRPQFRTRDSWREGLHASTIRPATSDSSNAYAVVPASGVVLKQCGDDLTRANVMKQAANVKASSCPGSEGIKANTSPTDFYPIQSVRLARFKGEKWDLFGEIISNEGDPVSTMEAAAGSPVAEQRRK
jgi:branched-chain amino acid transport system substrate-binding protein